MIFRIIDTGSLTIQNLECSKPDMNEYILKMTETETLALLIGSGGVPLSDNTSSLTKIFDYLDENTDLVFRSDELNLYKHFVYKDLIRCKI
jgi:hypothetical protein